MENYKIRREDLTKPIIGYFKYISRNWDSLILHENPNEAKAVPRALGLCFYHFFVIPGICLSALAGLEKVLG